MATHQAPQETPLAPPNPDALPPNPRPRKSWRWLVIVTIITLVAIGSIVVYLGARDESSRTPHSTGSGSKNQPSAQKSIENDDATQISRRVRTERAEIVKLFDKALADLKVGSYKVVFDSGNQPTCYDATDPDAYLKALAQAAQSLGIGSDALNMSDPALQARIAAEMQKQGSMADVVTSCKVHRRVLLSASVGDDYTNKLNASLAALLNAGFTQIERAPDIIQLTSAPQKLPDSKNIVLKQFARDSFWEEYLYPGFDRFAYLKTSSDRLISVEMVQVHESVNGRKILSPDNAHTFLEGDLYQSF